MGAVNNVTSIMSSGSSTGAILGLGPLISRILSTSSLKLSTASQKVVMSMVGDERARTTIETHQGAGEPPEASSSFAGPPSSQFGPQTLSHHKIPPIGGLGT